MNEPSIDLTGKLIIKVALGDDIRRILITNEDITYDELVLMMQRVYRGKLSSTDDIMIKYKDEDGDLITIFDSSDLTFAIQCSRILKITLFVNNKPEPLQSNEVKMIKAEVKHIRDRCNSLLDRLDDRVTPDIGAPTVDSTTNKGAPSQSVDSPRRPSPSPRAVPPTSAAGSKEFDPLSVQRSAEDQNKVLSSFGIANDAGSVERSGTPDSVSSVGSASGPRQTPQGPVSVPSQPGTPGPQPSNYTQGSGQKQHPWQQQQQQQQGHPSPYPGQAQGVYSPALARSMEWNRQYPGQNVLAGHDKPQFSRSYQTALMQSVLYSGHDSAARSSPVPRADTSSSSSYGPKPQTSYSMPTAQPISTPQFPGYSQSGQPQPQPQPGQPNMYSQQQQQQVPQQGPYPAQGQQVPGTQAQTMQMQGQPGQQQQQQPPASQQPQGVGYPGQQQPPGTMPGQMPPQQGANPYARQGPGYGAGYPRPSAGYPQGYQ